MKNQELVVGLQTIKPICCTTNAPQQIEADVVRA